MKKIKDFKKIIEFAPDAIIIINTKGNIEYANLQTEKIFGFKREELIDQKVEMLMPDRFRNMHSGHRERFFANPHPRIMGSRLNLFAKKKGGTEFPVEITLSPIEKDGLLAASVRDLTEKQLNDYLMNKTKHLEDFAYITSHNLRSPISNLSSLINFYKTENTSAEKEILFDKIEQTVTKLSETLNNLVDVLIIQQGSKKIKSKLNFESVYKKIVTNFESYIKDTSAKINVDFSQAPTIEYYRIYLESIIQNLLSNALKYSSPKRTSIINIKTSIVDNKIQLIISDNGLGIDLKKHGANIFGLNKIFHLNPGAKGVGLFITKVQVDSMGGQIHVESEVDKGTTFTIIF